MEFRILGPLDVVGDIGPVALGGPQQRKILAVLLSDPGRVLTYDRLVEVLWPDADEQANARRSAITYVSRLRSAIGGGVVQTTDVGYVLDPGAVSIDADRFVALLGQARSAPPDRAVDVFDEALALWRGPVFGDLNGEWWARPVATKLEELRLGAMGDRIDALTAHGWDGRAIAEATSLLDAHPLREQFVEKAMRGLHAIGQTADALRVFHRYRTELADQTGLDPSTALVDLESSMATGAALEPSTSDINRPLRGYILRELLGEGSFGAVYRATQPGVDRDVAVKVIRPELADDRSFVRRFEAEAQLVARLEHPHIVPLYDFWRQPGGAFLVFRLMRGGSADALIARNGPLPIASVNSVVHDIGGALTAAHSENVVHRDVKPANILFDDAGSAYLADFGIAASLAGEPLTPQRWSAGSALYASPEQLRDGVEDARADQYALAVTIWELLTGRARFGGDDASSVVATKLREPLGPVDAFAPVPTPLAAVLTRAGAVHPLDRYPSVAEFVGAWQRAYAGAIAGETNPAGGADVSIRTGAPTMLGIGRSAVNPYKGLRPFGEGDAADFYGRDALVDRLFAMVSGAPFVAVVGPSGSGKSSLVLAGVVPRLRVAGVVVTLTPGANPMGALAVALGQIAREDQADLLTPTALRRPDGLRDAIKSVAGDDDLVIVIDQLEELWTLAGNDDRRRFVDALEEPIRSGFARVIATVRADFFDRPLADPVLGVLASQYTFGVTPMTAVELHDAITLPAEQVGVRVESALTSQLVAETIDQPGSLPLLQFALAELFESRTGAVMTADAYAELGGLAGSLSRQADEIYAALDEGDRVAVRRMFSRLVAIGDSGQETRRRVAVSELAGVSDGVVSAFVNRRLLTSDRDRVSREPTLEIAHEVLLTSWPRLRSWLAEDRSWLRELRTLSAAATMWDAGGRDEGDLHRGARLVVVAELVGSHEEALTELEKAFLAESLDRATVIERERERRLADKIRQNRRLRRSLVGIAVVLVVALVAGAVALVQRQRADRQQRIAVQQQTIAEQQQQIADSQRAEADTQRALALGERATADASAKDAEAAATKAQNAETGSELTTLATRSLSARSSQRDLAALLAVEAWKRAPDATSKSALFGTFTFDPGFLGYLRFPGALALQGTAIPGTTEMLLTTYSPNTRGAGPARVIDSVTGAVAIQLDPLPIVADDPMDLAVSTNGRYAAEWTVDASGTSMAGAFDLSTGHLVGRPIATPQLLGPMAIDNTGTRLVLAADSVGRATIFDTTTGTAVADLPALPGAPTSADNGDGGGLAYSPDGRLFLGSTGEVLRIFDPVTFAQSGSITVPTGSTGGQLRFSSDGSTLVTRGVFVDSSGNQTGSIARIDPVAGSVRWNESGSNYEFGECSSLAFSVDTDQLWCANYFGLIRERSLDTGQRTGRVLQNQKGTATDLDVITGVDGTMLVAVGNNDGVLGRWRIDGGGPIQRRVAAGKVAISILPDGKTLLVGIRNGRKAPFDLDYTLWDSATDTAIPGFPSFLFAGTIGDIVYGAFSDGQIGTYDLVTGQRRSFAFDLSDVPTAAGASSDGSTVLLGHSDGSIAEFDAATGRQIQKMQLPTTSTGNVPAVGSLAFSNDRSRVYVAAFGLFVFDAATGREMGSNSNFGIQSVSVSPTGLVVASLFDGSLGIFDPTTAAQTESLSGARGFIQQLTFSSDGKLLLGAGSDGTVLLLDLESRTRLGDPIEVSPTPGIAIDLSDDGSAAAIGLGDMRGVAMWNLDPQRWVTAACAIAGRNLTRDEWTTYVGSLGSYHSTCPEYPAATPD